MTKRLLHIPTAMVWVRNLEDDNLKNYSGDLHALLQYVNSLYGACVYTDCDDVTFRFNSFRGIKASEHEFEIIDC